MFRKPTLRIVFCLTAVALCASLARADYEAGQTAWKAGRHAEALTEWRAAARTDDGQAMLALGRVYVKGLGIPQDYVEAHKWLNLAAARGNAEAATERDALAAKMTTEEQAEARRLARAWRSGGRVEPPKSASVPSATTPTAPAGPPPPRAIREAQGLMAALGYKPGPADGLWGGRTGRAYKAFLRDVGLPPAEMLTPDALRAMRAAAKGRNVAAATASPRQAPASQHQADPPPADLHRLVAAGDVDGLKSALAAGVDPNARDGKGWTALMHAADTGYALIVPDLLGAGADPNLRLPDGATALFIAAVHGHSEIVSLLVKGGADVSIGGPKGKTPLDVARAAGHLGVLTLPTIVAWLEAEARTKQDEEARKEREKQARKMKEAEKAFSLAKSSDTAKAYRDYLSTWCPGADPCAEARKRLNKTMALSLVGRTFGGISSLGHEQVYSFPRMGEISGVSRPSSWTSNRCSGAWRVEKGEIHAVCEWGGGVGRSVVTAELDSDVLAGSERYGREGVASFFGPSVVNWTWRLKERSNGQSPQTTETDNIEEDDLSYLGGD